MNRRSLYQAALAIVLYFPLSASLGCEGSRFDSPGVSTTGVGGDGGVGGVGGVGGAATTSSGVGSSPGMGGTGGTTGGTGGSGGMASQCAPGFELCNGLCIEPLTDTAHCGGCAKPACGMGRACVGGVCQCQGGLADCFGTCTNTASDRNNCGTCGTVCAEGLFCSLGSCGATCALTECPGSVCTDTNSDPFNCGDCGTQCMGGQQCNGGQCGCASGTCPDGSCNTGSCSCPGGQTYCASSNGCMNTQTDPNNCGTCGMQCTDGKQCSGGQCACPNGTCPDGSCNTGSCSCPGGQTYCSNSNTCADTQTDTSNCGSCGRACAQTEACVNGNCGGNCSEDNTTYNGRMTYYDLGGNTPACHFPPNSLPQYYGAMNEQDYAAAAVCGACVEIRNTQNNSTLMVQIVDECPCAPPNEQWCCDAQSNHHIDVNQSTYSALGANDNPSITWHYVPCAANGNLIYYFDPAAKEGYLAVTIMNHRYRIKRVTADGQQLSRRDYNVWESTSLGPGPFTFQVTDVYDRTITDSNVPLMPGQMVQSSAQFAACQ